MDQEAQKGQTAISLTCGTVQFVNCGVSAMTLVPRGWLHGGGKDAAEACLLPLQFPIVLPYPEVVNQCVSGGSASEALNIELMVCGMLREC